MAMDRGTFSTEFTKYFAEKSNGGDSPPKVRSIPAHFVSCLRAGRIMLIWFRPKSKKVLTILDCDLK
jgi:hypothetical protein